MSAETGEKHPGEAAIFLTHFLIFARPDVESLHGADISGEKVPV